MSHFAVAVFTKTGSWEELQAALQPFHEFESTGTDDQYVQDIDETEDVLTGYREGTRPHLRSPEGRVTPAYDDQFYREPTSEEREKLGPVAGTGWWQGLHGASKDWGDGKGYRTKVHYVPEGYEEVDVPYSKCMSIEEYIEYEYGEGRVVASLAEVDLSGPHKFGYAIVEGGILTKAVDRTNPNAKWDRWQAGGRYAGRLLLSHGHSVDSARKGDVDISRIRRERAAEAARDWDRVYEVLGEATQWQTWEGVRDSTEDINQAREIYTSQDAVKALRENEATRWDNLDDYAMSRSEYLDRARRRGLVVFAAVLDGKWAERGQMGWWGCVSDENEDWSEVFNQIWDSVPDDYYVTIVDCHIRPRAWSKENK